MLTERQKQILRFALSYIGMDATTFSPGLFRSALDKAIMELDKAQKADLKTFEDTIKAVNAVSVK